jgi:hypothetical protein
VHSLDVAHRETFGERWAERGEPVAQRAEIEACA